MTAHPKPTHPVEQIVGDVKAAIRSIGPHGRVVLTVEKWDGAFVHRVERSRLTEEDLDRLMRQVPRPKGGAVSELGEGQKPGSVDDMREVTAEEGKL